MNETPLDEEPLVGVVAEHDSLDAAQVLVAPHDTAVHLRRGNSLLGGEHPVAGIGMRGLPLGNRSAGRVPLALEDLEHVDRALGVVPQSHHVPEAQLVGLALVVAPELEEQHAQPTAERVAERPQLRHQHGGRHEADLHQLRASDLLHAVPCRDVPDLVPEHGGHLRLAIEVGHDTPGQIHGPAGESEGVDDRVVHDLEGPGQLRTLGHRRQSLSHGVDVRLQIGVVVQAHAGIDFGHGLLSHLDFLALAHEREHASARRRVDGTCTEGDDRGGQDEV